MYTSLCREQINPCGGMQTRPIYIPAKPQDVAICHTLKLAKTSFLYAANGRHIVTEDKNQSPPDTCLTTVLQNALQERRIEIVATVFRTGKGIVQINLIATWIDHTVNLADFHRVVRGPAIRYNFGLELCGPELFATFQTGLKLVPINKMAGVRLHRPSRRIQQAVRHWQPCRTQRPVVLLQIDLK